MKRKVLFVLCLLLGLLFINAGLDKFFHYMPIPEDLPEPMVNMSMSMMERSEEHTSELQSLMRISYAVFCLKKKKNNIHTSMKIHNRSVTRILSLQQAST